MPARMEADNPAGMRIVHDQKRAVACVLLALVCVISSACSSYLVSASVAPFVATGHSGGSDYEPGPGVTIGIGGPPMGSGVYTLWDIAYCEHRVDGGTASH